MLSAFATVLAGIGGNETILACVNAVIGFLLALVNYLKLDAAQEAHKISSRQYATSSQVLNLHLVQYCYLIMKCQLMMMMKMTKEKENTIKPHKKLNLERSYVDVENKITEIKETNQFLTPYA